MSNHFPAALPQFYIIKPTLLAKPMQTSCGKLEYEGNVLQPKAKTSFKNASIERSMKFANALNDKQAVCLPKQLQAKRITEI